MRGPAENGCCLTQFLEGEGTRMAIGAGLRLGFWRLSCCIRAIRPLLSTAFRYRPGLGLVAIGFLLWSKR